jgi:hypothetical protein
MLHPPGGPVSPDDAAEGHADWLIDPETLLLVEDDAGDAVLVEELLRDSGLRASLTWARTLTEAKMLLGRRGVPGCRR